MRFTFGPKHLAEMFGILQKRNAASAAVALCGIAIVLFPACACARDYDVRDFGARGDGTTKNTEAIQRAINTCSAAGGGRVVLEGGRYITGTILLKDGVDLHLDVTGTLVGSPDWRDWRDQPDSRHLNMPMCPRRRNAALIFADEAKGVAITGRGRIDANGRNFVEPVPDYREGLRYRRIYGVDKSPPRAVLFAGCSDVTVTDVTLNNLPAGWGFWVHDCDRVRFDRVNILTPVDYPNNDGIHVNCSRDVTISNCIIETGDDCIIVRANSASLKENRTCERVCVVNCSLRTYANGIRIAWLNDGVIRDCVFSNIVINRSANGIGIVLPAWSSRENIPDQGREATLVENLSFSNIVMDRMNARPVDISIAASSGTRCAAIRNIRFSNLICRGLEFPRLVGREGNMIEDVAFVDCTFTKVPDTTPGYENWRQDGWSYGLRCPGSPERVQLKNVTFERCVFKDNCQSKK